ncbi:unnamed protein product [Meganyctiphanes norvegica]|uniref:C2H2-type domain-containing protein n=1 Tax=Meganyctiphanes norvegica TaxID=48144 RepID=A0AAV2R0V8_MEGNR
MSEKLEQNIIEESFETDANYFQKKPVRFDSESSLDIKKSIQFGIVELDGSPNIGVGYIARDFKPELLDKCVIKKNNVRNDVKDLPFKCTNCDFISGCKDELKTHVNTCADQPTLTRQPGDIYKTQINDREKKVNTIKETVKRKRISKKRGKSDLRNKKNVNEGDKPFKCNTCEYSTNLKHNLVAHSKRVHLEGPIKRKKSSANLIICHICDYKVYSNRDFQRHIVIHSDERPLECSECDYRGKRDTDIRRHMLVHRRSDEKPFKCSECDHRTHLKSHLKIHMRRHTGERRPSKFSPANPLSCHLCTYKTLDRYCLKTHLAVHSDEKPFSCPEPGCDFKGKRKSDIRSHSFSHAVGEKHLKCTECEFSARKPNNLKRHMKIHTGEKSCICPLCDYKCLTTDRLKSHLLSHTAERPHKCIKCGAAFKQSFNLTAHMLIHTDQPKNYKCDLCDYSCVTSSVLKKHMHSHSEEKPFKCPECDYKCKLKCNLKTHMRIHSNERPYACIYCAYSSTSSSTLRKHILRHERPYMCEHIDCFYSFAFSKELQKHMLTHEEINKDNSAVSNDPQEHISRHDVKESSTVSNDTKENIFKHGGKENSAVSNNPQEPNSRNGLEENRTISNDTKTSILNHEMQENRDVSKDIQTHVIKQEGNDEVPEHFLSELQ